MVLCTPETLFNCQEINLMRMNNDLVPLTIVEINHLSDDSGGIVSSSRIRYGSHLTQRRIMVPSFNPTEEF